LPQKLPANRCSPRLLIGCYELGIIGLFAEASHGTRPRAMSLFPVVSQLDAVDANYLTAVTQEGFLVHYHDLQRLDGPGENPPDNTPPPICKVQVPGVCADFLDDAKETLSFFL